MKRFILIFFVVMAQSCSCNREVTLSSAEMLKMVKQGDPEVIVVLPSSEKEVIRCSHYRPVCKRAYTAKIKDLSAIFLEYNSEKEAKSAAILIKAYYVKNWVLDDVTGEPILERFVKKYLKAKNYDE